MWLFMGCQSEFWMTAASSFTDSRRATWPMKWRQLSGPVPVIKRAEDGRTVLAIALDPAPLFKATGSNADNLVAGAAHR